MITGEFVFLSKEILRCCFSRPFYVRRLVDQIISLGFDSLPIVTVIGLVAGLVMALEFGFGLNRFGGTLYVPSVVSLSVTRELAPIFTALLLAGRVGSGIAAEIGSMNVTQQVDAIRALGTSPTRVLIVPRLLASMISFPLLTIWADTMGLWGSFLICRTEFKMSWGFYWNKVLETLDFEDVFTGMAKTVFFAAIIGITACYKGLRTKSGTRDVGNTTTWVVVNSSIAILILDFFLTKLFVVLF